MFDGSAIATTSVAPLRLTGMTWCFSQISLGISLSTAASISISPRLMDGRLYCRATTCVTSWSLTRPILANVTPSRWPVRLDSSCACCSCDSDSIFSRTSSSPSRLGAPAQAGAQLTAT
jgi:hypothetical protein